MRWARRTEALKAAGIKVFTRGIGNAGGEPIPVLQTSRAIATGT